MAENVMAVYSEYNSILPKICENNGIVYSIIPWKLEDPDDKYSGIYIVLSPDASALNKLEMQKWYLEEILDYNKTLNDTQINPWFQAIKIPKDIGNKNKYYFNSKVMRTIQDLSMISRSYWEFGYTMPKWVGRSSLSTFYELANKRELATTREQKDFYTDAHKQAVARSYRSINDLEQKPEYELKPFSKHRVDKDYFFKYHIKQVNATISEDFWHFIKPKIKETPDFIYYKEIFPYKSEIVECMDGVDRKKGHYRIMFPASQEKTFYGWMLENNIKYLDSIVPVEQVTKSPKGYFAIEVDNIDLCNINSLCKTNNVPYAIDTKNKITEMTMERVEKPTILFRREDEEMVEKILNRIAIERREWVPVTQEQRDNAKKMRPKSFDNPFVPTPSVKKIEDERTL